MESMKFWKKKEKAGCLVRKCYSYNILRSYDAFFNKHCNFIRQRTGLTAPRTHKLAVYPCTCPAA